MESQFSRIVTYFLIYSFLGWVVEVIYRSFKEKQFVNGGVNMGPWCPIYGFGVLIALWLHNKIALLGLDSKVQNIIILFIGVCILASILEYATGVMLEKEFKIKAWDYSTQPHNIGGKISPKFTLCWGVASVIVITVIHKYIAAIVENPLYSEEIGLIIAVAIVLFIVDVCYTTIKLIRKKWNHEKNTQK